MLECHVLFEWPLFRLLALTCKYNLGEFLLQLSCSRTVLILGKRVTVFPPVLCVDFILHTKIFWDTVMESLRHYCLLSFKHCQSSNYSVEYVYYCNFFDVCIFKLEVLM
jgi:hypothetical protein